MNDPNTTLDDPKKPTQIPPGDLSDAVGTHEEGDFDDDEPDNEEESDEDEE
jgi:hypothetical protein